MLVITGNEAIEFARLAIEPEYDDGDKLTIEGRRTGKWAIKGYYTHGDIRCRTVGTFDSENDAYREMHRLANRPIEIRK